MEAQPNSPHSFKKNLHSLLGVASLPGLVVTANAQVVYGTANATISQNFDWTSTGSATGQTIAWTSNASSQPVTTVN